MVGFLLYWLRWIRSLYVFYIHYNKSRKPAKVFLLSHPIFIVSYSVVISILLLFLLPSKELPVRIEINKQKSSSRLFSQFSPTPVRSVVLRMFSKRFYGCVILPGSLPSPCAGLQLVTKPSHRKEEYNRSGSKEINYSVTVSKVSGPTFMVKGICLYMQGVLKILLQIKML